MPADPFAADEYLRRGPDIVFGLEGVGRLARGEVMILHLIARAFQQVFRLQPIGADMVRHDHAVENCLFRACRLGRHVRHLSLNCVRSAADNGSVPWYGIKRAGRSRSANLPRRAVEAWKRSASTNSGAF